MSATASVWFVIVLAAVAANLPFANERLFAVLPLKSRRKAFWMRLCELVALYAVVGGIAWALEKNIGSVQRQGWEFYAITGCLFIVLAYPGFVHRYLRRHHR